MPGIEAVAGEGSEYMCVLCIRCSSLLRETKRLTSVSAVSPSMPGVKRSPEKAPRRSRADPLRMAAHSFV
eukprot:361381-Prorocentrum_minimum.AAC.1